MNGKGSRRRPQQVSDEELERRWAAAFGETEEDRICRELAVDIERVWLQPWAHMGWCDGCGEVYTEQEDSDGSTACDCCAPGRPE